MKCKQCGSIKRGSRGIYRQGFSGEYWKCSECKTLTKIEKGKQKPNLCPRCKFSVACGSDYNGNTVYYECRVDNRNIVYKYDYGCVRFQAKEKDK